MDTMSDITPQQRPSYRSNRPRELFDATEDLAIWIDAAYTIRQSTPSFQHVTGWKKAVSQHLTCRQTIICSDDAGHVLCDSPRCPLQQFGEQQPAIAHITTQTGTMLPMFHQIKDVGNQMLLLILRDASMIVDVQKQRDRFLADVSHKMRNRLNSIHGFVELVASGHVGPIDPQQQLMLTYAHMSSMELMEYVENLVFMTRADQRQTTLSIGNVHIGDLLEEVTQYLDFVAISASVELTVDAPETLPEIQGDHYRLRHAVSNITMNAIKFTPPQGTVLLHATTSPTEIIISVKDTGVGIDPDDAVLIFDPSYQSERMAHIGKSCGGMGLATAKYIVEQHQGSLDFTSIPDKGTTFIIHLPIFQPGETAT